MKKLVVFVLALVTAIGIRAATSQSYVQDGLVAQWDGIENVGRGQHDATARFWADISGNGHNFANFINGLSWNEDSLQMPSSDYEKAAVTTGIAARNCVSFEIVYKQTSAKNNPSILFAFDSFKGLAIPSSRDYLGVHNGAGGCWACPSVVTLNEPHHVYVCYKSGSSIKSESVVLDGAELTTSTATLDQPNAGYNIGFKHSSLTRTNRAFSGRIYTIRIYSRQLTEAEREWNRQVDAVRFSDKDETTLLVSSALRCGAPSPAYGAHTLGDESVTCSSAAEWRNDDGTVVAQCLGYTLYRYNPETGSREFVRTSADLSVTIEKGDAAQEVEWLWDAKVLPQVEVKGNGTVSSVGWTEAGESFEVEATAADGSRFGFWSGDVPANADATNPKLTMTAGIPAPQLVANFQKTVYVAVNGSDENGGTSWNDAFATVRKALDSDDAPYVMVGAGTYTSASAIAITKPATICGSEIGGEPASVFTVSKEAGNVFVLSNEYACLTHVALTTGGAKNNDWGRGVLLYGMGLVDNCVITNCRSYNGNKYYNGRKNDGGGVQLYNGGTVRNCRIENCYSWSNASSYPGGGVAIYGAGLVENCRIVKCHANRPSGGGVYMTGGTLRNSLIAGCYMDVGTDGTAISMTGGTVENCTFADCYHPSSASATAVAATGGTIRNSIVWGNYNTSGAAPNSIGSAAQVTHCTSEVVLPGDGNITVDPAFTDAANGDYTIRLSDCVDAGMPCAWHDGAKDLKGEDRVMGEAVDLGCYELKPSALSVGVSAVSDGGVDKAGVLFSAQVSGTATGTTEYDWTITGPYGYEKKAVGSGDAYATLALELSAGVYSASVTVRRGTDTATDTKAGLVTVLAFNTYVAPGGTGATPYTDETQPGGDIQSAFDMTGVGGTVHLAAGFYTMPDTLDMNRNVRIVADEGVGSATVYTNPKTGERPAVNINSFGAVLDGVVVSGYSENRKTRPDQYHGITVDTKGGTVTNCIIDGVSGNAGGAGVLLRAGLLVDSTIRNSLITAGGGNKLGSGLKVEGGLAERCVITNNTAARSGSAMPFGGGVYLSGGTLRNSIVAYNTCSGNGGGIQNAGGSVVNCLVCDNVAAQDGAGVFQGNGSLLNLTIADNRTNTADVVGCSVTGGTMKNCIVWGNEGTVQFAGAADASNCCESDPKFRNAACGDYRLSSASSACIDRGDDEPWIDLGDAVDLLGNPRLRRAHVDIGCYERQFTALILTVK